MKLNDQSISACNTANERCRVVFLYEEALTGRQALRIYQHLQANLTGGCLLIARHWSFNEIGETKTREDMLENIRTADIVTIATRDVAGLPTGTMKLLQDGFVGRTTKPAALALLIGRTTMDPTPATTLLLALQELAQSNGLDFFPSEFAMPTALQKITRLTQEIT